MAKVKFKKNLINRGLVKNEMDLTTWSHYIYKDKLTEESKREKSKLLNLLDQKIPHKYLVSFKSKKKNNWDIFVILLAIYNGF